jgi:hypothetical protein
MERVWIGYGEGMERVSIPIADRIDTGCIGYA